MEQIDEEEILIHVLGVQNVSFAANFQSLPDKVCLSEKQLSRLYPISNDLGWLPLCLVSVSTVHRWHTLQQMTGTRTSGRNVVVNRYLPSSM